TIVSALLPLIIGASVGPEAGLTGIIAGLCTWVGDKLKRFRREVEELTEIGLSATLGTIFRSPMFGFMEPIEADEEAVLPKASKIVLYFAAILSSFGVFILLNRLFGIEVGIEGMEAESLSPLTYMYAIPLTIAGIAGGWLFFLFEKLTAALKNKFSKYTVLRATTGGVLLGIFGMLLPLTMFSGESQITQVTENMKAIGAGMLILIAIAKLLLTNICIESGLKGGHFFPVIFCGICIGCALSLVFNVSATLCAAAATTALVGHTLKKPIATVLLLMIIFPPGMIPIMLFSAIAARFIPTPKFLLSKNI
ncbi:MAG: chloride channel protein, partial [Ruminococcus sp.]|nr:chloride channel protein [Ruminococcus sp.]